LVGLYDRGAPGSNADNRYELAVLKRKSGSATVSLLYLIDPSTGEVFSKTTVPASRVDGWNGNFFLTKTNPLPDTVRPEFPLMVSNGNFNAVSRVNNDVSVGATNEQWPDLDVITPTNTDFIFGVNKGIIWRIDVDVRGDSRTKKLSRANWNKDGWTISSMVYYGAL
jgi:hypothetical protein